MNWHLFLDVMAWIWGSLFSFACLWLIARGMGGEVLTKEYDKPFFVSLTIASFCWAWIIAG